MEPATCFSPAALPAPRDSARPGCHRDAELVPLYAAGAGMPDTALHVASCAGWNRYDDDLGDVTMVTPDGQLAVEFGPENGARPIIPLWRVTWRNPDPYRRDERAWTAHFSSHVPAEAIAAFLQALIDAPPVAIDRWDLPF